IQRQVSVVYGNQNNTYAISGTTPEYGEIRNLPLAAGAWFTRGDVNGATNVAVIGANVATDLFAGGDPLGQMIRINRLAFRVAGVAAPKGGGGFGSLDNGVYVPVTSAQRKLFGRGQAAVVGHTVNTIYIQVDDKDNMTAAQEQVTDLLHTRHRLP